MREPRWEYLQPADREELFAAMAQMTEDSVFLAGGTDLLCEIREAKIKIDRIVSLGLLKEFSGIRLEGDGIRIGSMATHGEIAADPNVRRYLRALAEACAHVGSKQIRNKGTIGGNLMNASPAGDMIPCFFLLHGKAEILSSDGTTRFAGAGEFYRGGGAPAMERNEVLAAVHFPVVPERDSFFVKLGSRTEVTIAQISACMSAKKKDGMFEDVEFYLGSVDRTPLPVPEAAAILGGSLGTVEERNQLSELLSKRIQEIQAKRKRPPRLKIRESERHYKERAVKGVVYDLLDGFDRP